MAASLIGWVGNEVVAIFRIHVGKEIQSAALIADGYHACVDGLTSLAVFFGALGVYSGYPPRRPACWPHHHRGHPSNCVGLRKRGTYSPYRRREPCHS